jgi:hypothetical protein
MPAISIPCPACGASLKLPDTSLIGKTARCPKCRHRFVLALPETDEVSLALADVPVLPLAPRMGTGARWVPDEAPAYPAAPPAAPVFPQFQQTPDAGAFGSPPLNGGSSEIVIPDFLAPPTAAGGTASTAEINTGAPFTASAVSPNALAGSTRAKGKPAAKKRRRGSRAGIIAMVITTILVAAGGYGAYVINQQKTQQVRKTPAVNKGWEAKKVELAASNESAEALSPTSGKAIPLDYLPFTPHLICHLRPAALWRKSDRTTVEFQAILGDLGTWLHEQIRSRTHFEPEDIEELTLAVNFGPRMSVPDVAVVVRLKEAQAKSNFLKQFKGQRKADSNAEIYESSEFSFMLIDDRTFAAAPVSLTQELELSRNDAALASPDMEPLLQASDRERHASLIFDLKILDSHREDIFMAQMQKVVDKFVVWMGNEIETVSWSMHLEPNFYMETLLHNSSDSSVLKVQRHAQMQFSKLAEEMLAGVEKMKPATVGSRQMIGRFPAMLQALDVGTTAHVAPSFARLVTVLPKQASVNLAAGALLTWNQSLLTNFDEEKVVAKGDTTSIPDKLIDRLQMKVLIDFRRTPLQEAFGYIGESIKTEVAIDGDALKGAGFTQNMPQTFDLGSVTAQAALHEIILKYAKERDPLVLIVDEKAKKLILSTKVKAEADGLTTFDTAPKK